MSLKQLLNEVRGCSLCAASLPLGPRPLVQCSATARLLIVGQAPGTAAHESGVPWNDRSGARLRDWLGLSDEQFYDSRTVAMMPMGFCYPGSGRSGDMPPRPECAPQWHALRIHAMPRIALTVYAGSYAIKHYLPVFDRLTSAVQGYASLLPSEIALPHPSPRNNLWLKKHPWFERDVLPELRSRVATLVTWSR